VTARASRRARARDAAVRAIESFRLVICRHGYVADRPATSAATLASGASAAISGCVDAFTWQRAHDSRAWQVAQLALARSDAGACALANATPSCEAGFGNAAIRSLVRPVAAVSGTWQVEHRLSSARCALARCVWHVRHVAGSARRIVMRCAPAVPWQVAHARPVESVSRACASCEKRAIPARATGSASRRHEHRSRCDTRGTSPRQAWTSPRCLRESRRGNSRTAETAGHAGCAEKPVARLSGRRPSRSRRAAG
jgi:hypothetical protein